MAAGLRPRPGDPARGHEALPGAAAPPLRPRGARFPEHGGRRAGRRRLPDSSARSARSTSRSRSRSAATTCSPPGPTARASSTRSRRDCARTRGARPAPTRRRVPVQLRGAQQAAVRDACARPRTAAVADDGAHSCSRPAGRSRMRSRARATDAAGPRSSSRSSASARRRSSRCAPSRARAAWTSRSRRPGVVSIPLVHGRPGDAAGVRAAAGEDRGAS